jgi:ABC-type nickel/cobalt efflux system permease component RcnA
MSVTIVLIALIALFSQATLSKVRNSMRVIEIVSAIFLVAVGIYLIIFGLYENQGSDLASPLTNLITSIFQLQGKIISAVNSLLTSIGILN